MRNTEGWDEDASQSGATQPDSGGKDSSQPMTGPKQCTKILPASSSAPKYKFVVPNEFVSKWMQPLIEQPFRMIDGQGGSWDMVLIQRRNKEKYEYMLQGWRRFGEEMGVQEGDTVVFEMVDVHTMLLNIVQRASGSRIKILRAKAEAAAVAAAAAGHGHPGLGQHLHPGLGGPGPEGGLGPHGGLGPGLAAPDLLALMHQQAGYMQGGGGPGGPPPPHGLGGPGHAPPGMASQLAAAPAPGGGGGSMLGPPRLPSPVDPYAHGGPGPSPGYHPNGTPGPSPLDYLGGAHGHGHGHGHVPPGSLDHQDKRPRTELGLPGGPPGVAGPGAGGASSGIAMLSDVADLDLLMQENLILREELRAAEGKIAMLESGVLNIKAVLTKSTDPGLVAMTGVMNLLNQLESGDLTPDVPPHVRIALQGVCSEIRRHLNGVMRMVWVLRSLPEDVQRENGAGGPGGPPPGMDPQQQQ